MINEDLFRKEVVLKPDKDGLFLLEEEQNNTQQKIRFGKVDNSIVLKSEKMRNLWFDKSKDGIPKICDFIAVYEQNDKWHCVLIELKSNTNKKIPKAIEQLKKGKRMAHYLLDITDKEMSSCRNIIFYKGKQHKGRIKKPALKNPYRKHPYDLSNTNKMIGEKC